MKTYHPVTPSRRSMSGIDYRSALSGEKKPVKKLTKSLKKSGGRGRDGRISVRHKGGGHKRRYRIVDFGGSVTADVKARIEAIQYDPSRSTFIAQIVSTTGERSYILAPQKVSIGDSVSFSQKRIPVRPGNRMRLKYIPVGTYVHNVELQPGRGGVLARSAGISAQVMAREGGRVNLRLPSTEVRQVSEDALASIGELSNAEHRMVTFGKAGRSRWKGIRPTVRGSAMNPVDHPFGGGEGRAGAGLRRPRNAWGKGVRGVKTRNKKKQSSIFIVSRRKTKKRSK